MWTKKQQLEPDTEQLSGSKLGRELQKRCILTAMQSNLCKMPGWMNHKLESRLLGKKINNLRYVDDTTLMAESKEELKSRLMRVKEETEKAGLKFNIQKMKIMASGPITSWQIEGEKWKQ